MRRGTYLVHAVIPVNSDCQIRILHSSGTRKKEYYVEVISPRDDYNFFQAKVADNILDPLTEALIYVKFEMSPPL